DRFFLDRVTTGILAFEGEGSVVYYAGGYDVYRAGRTVEPEIASEPKPSAAPREKKERPKKRTYQEEREFQGMEAKNIEAEAGLAALEKELSDAEIVKKLGPKVKDKMAELDAARREVESLYARWADLGAIEKSS